MLVIDSAQQILFANPAVENIFGYAPGEVVGKPLAIFQPPEIHARHHQAIQRFLDTGMIVDSKRPPTETTGIHKDGHQIHLEIAFSEMRLHMQPWMVAFVRDVTARKIAEQKVRDNQEQFRIAKEIQQRLFPPGPPVLPGFDIAGTSLPAEAAGGDYFDYFPMNDGTLGIVIGDVSGHGIGPAMLMSEARAYLRLLARSEESLQTIFDKANLALVEDTGSERYITLLLIKLDASHNSITFTNAGHPAGFILDKSGAVKAKLIRSGPPLGLISDMHYPTPLSLGLDTGDLLVLVTDGFLENVSPAEELYGMDRFLDVIRANQSRPCQEIMQAVFQSAQDFSQTTVLMDDLTVVLLKKEG